METVKPPHGFSLGLNKMILYPHINIVSGSYNRSHIAEYLGNIKLYNNLYYSCLLLLSCI